MVLKILPWKRVINESTRKTKVDCSRNDFDDIFSSVHVRYAFKQYMPLASIFCIGDLNMR